MARTVRHPRSRPRAAAHHNRQVAAATGVLLLAVCLYSVVIEPDAWLWFGWAVLLLVCVALFAVRP
ncbi:hypothetical protein [Kitasatospora sp. NPDC001547]|uniref:hypothetical protein n=1 Tax=Kitasatospora sp. NPDC001547 TaxID=3364015 RepID=UPI003680A984|nr:hypothetical protein KitaXyl93_21010 [Kitasatospora sp. Xyl93]